MMKLFEALSTRRLHAVNLVAAHKRLPGSFLPAPAGTAAAWEAPLEIRGDASADLGQGRR